MCIIISFSRNKKEGIKMEQMPDKYAVLIAIVIIVLIVYAIISDNFALDLLKSVISAIMLILIYFENKKLSVALGIIILLLYWIKLKKE